MGVEFNLISKDAQTSLTEFSQDFAMAYALGEVDEWAKRLGLYRPSRALKTVWPIPVSAAGYKELKGDLKYRSLMEKSVELSPKTWQDGVAELASIIEAPDFIGWAGEPQRMAAEARRMPNEIIAGLLESNPTLPIDEKALFASDHPNNVFKSGQGTFDNDLAASSFADAVMKLKAYFRSVKGPNGKPMGLRLTDVLVGAGMEEEARDFLENDLLIETVGSSFGAINNRHKGTVNLTVVDEFEDGDKVYGLARNKPGLAPWVVQDEGSPEEIIQDKTSDLYARTLKIAFASILRGNGGILLPHPLARATVS